MELRRETKRFIAIKLGTFFTGIFCNLFQHPIAQARFREILSGLALGDDELDDLRSSLTYEVTQHVPGLEAALRSLKLNPSVFFDQVTKQCAWVALAHMKLFVTAVSLEQVASSSLKLSAMFRQQIIDGLDANASCFAHMLPKQERVRKAHNTSWRHLFATNAVYSEFEEKVAAAKAEESAVKKQDKIRSSGKVIASARPIFKPGSLVFDPSK
jgi:hypothetical protein